MNFTKLIPNVYYRDINDGLKLFIDCLEFSIGRRIEVKKSILRDRKGRFTNVSV